MHGSPPPAVVGRLWIAALLFAAGCSHDAAPSDPACYNPYAPEGAILVPGTGQWVETGVEIQAGNPVTVTAHGSITVGRSKSGAACEVSPAGTYLFGDEVADACFPLPAAAGGPAPCYCLIGRIGDGPPFYIGRGKSWTAETSGKLQLGINDFEFCDNSGEFYVQVKQPRSVQPISFEQTVSSASSISGAGPRCCGSSVVVFYIDGLRPDVVREMAGMGHIPNINCLFIEGGSWLANTFTAFPSDTITSNGTMWTGCFSDRHGLKGQVRFSRRTLHSHSYLEPLGPHRSAGVLAPRGIDGVVHEAQAASIGLLRGREEGERWDRSRVSGVPPLYRRLQANGGDWATGVLPMMTEVPPLLWTRSLVRKLPYLKSHDSWKYIDDANTHYALQELIARHEPVTIIWLPETDSISHKFSRGQFGVTRRTIARADILIGKVVEELQALGRLHNTYLMLVSDHGHHGGRQTHLSHFDIANDLIYRPREITPDGDWVGGGLGLSVRQHRIWNRHSGDKSREFVFVDGDSDGAARIFLPRCHYRSGNWSGTARPADLLAYRIAPHLPPLNLVDVFTQATALRDNCRCEQPVDLVLMKLDDCSVLISTADRGQAVIRRRKNAECRWEYQYRPVADVAATEEGGVCYTPIEDPEIDPLGLLNHLPARLLEEYHDEEAWLQATLGIDYPDGVVALTRHMLWDENLRYREEEYAPDLVVTARKGWYFGTQDSPGTMHGYPFPDAMRASLFVSGPGIRRGTRIEAPCRLVDLTPTILEMVGAPFDPRELDGRPIRRIYQPASEADPDETRPVYWRDVDLAAWTPLAYRPNQRSEYLPITVNRPTEPTDLNNIAYNLLSISELNVLRLLDDVISPLSGSPGRGLTAVENLDRRVRRSGQDSVREGAHALNLTGTSLGDYSPTSLGNLRRADGVIDWVQKRGRNLDEKLAAPLGRHRLPGSRLVHGSVDGVQGGFWELYRFTQRVVVQVLEETLLNGIENSTDRSLNYFRRHPAEIVVEPVPVETPPPEPRSPE